ncbi:PQQ-binding-like beta-propeller repeat protein [Nocardiopsis sp. B62]|uniref:outer membrane protein assembly factor BamB family protein n=1 Tax=Nocardiopsis sp. B62 TaxID=2824874 RepID=UPI001FFD246C|nr:PQQ-binding-like beta-propeller repeat protein [Nocardiopsis sp. B62]
MVPMVGCSVLGPEHTAREPGEPPEYRSSVTEIAWTWEPPGDLRDVRLREMDEGIAVLTADGVHALSGESGEELWSYRDRGQSLVSEVTDSGEHVVLYDKDTSRTTLMEMATGRVSHEFESDLSGVEYTREHEPFHLESALRGISGETWIVRWEDSVSSYELSTGEPLWSVPNVPDCSDAGQVDSLTVQTDVVVAATTCFEQPEGEESVAWTVGQDFTSELVGLSPDTGEELWRVEHSIGRMPHESLERTISSRPGGLVHTDFHYRGIGDSLLDIKDGAAIHLDTGELVWTSPDGTRLGVWDTETGQYRIEDLSGNVERVLERQVVSMKENMVVEGHRVGLEEGVLYLEDWMEDASDPEGFARFEGLEDSVVLTWDDAVGLSVINAISVPGAVAVAYVADGQAGVMGLR